MDTNALFWPFVRRVRLDEELERLLPGTVRLAVAEASLPELDRLVERGVAAAPLARRLAERCELLPSLGRGDDAVLAAAIAASATLATADRSLAARARSAGLGVVVPRDRARLGLQAPRPSTGARATVKLARRSSATRRARGRGAGRRSAANDPGPRVR